MCNLRLVAWLTMSMSGTYGETTEDPSVEENGSGTVLLFMGVFTVLCHAFSVLD